VGLGSPAKKSSARSSFSPPFPPYPASKEVEAMNNALRNSLIAAWMGWFGLGLVAKANEAGSKPQFSVCVRNYAGVPASTLGRAEKITQRIFEHAGIGTTWMDSVLPPTDGQENPLVNTSCASSLPRVFVNLISRQMAESLGLPNDTLGLAPGTPQEADRDKVFVFDEVVNELVMQQRAAGKSVILGHAMAHEIGHILTIAKHSPNGLMRATWYEEDFEAMAVGLLNFNSEQAMRIQAEITRRTRQQAKVQLAAKLQ
jgi:hypothetical protein